MRMLLTLAALATLPAAAIAGDAGCDNSCGTGCSTGCGKSADDYTCKLNVESEEVEKDCFVVEQEAICIAPVRKPSLRELMQGNKCGTCGSRCDAAGSCDACGDVCDSACDSGCAFGCGDGCGGSGLKGLLSRLCQSKCRVRIVNKLGKESVPDGEKCVYEWEAVPKCGRCGACDLCEGCSEGCVP